MMEAEGHLLLILHAPPGADDDTRVGRLFWLSPGGEWMSTEQGSGLGSLQTHVEQFGERFQKLDDVVDEATKSEDYFTALNELAPLVRAARHLHQVLQEARKARPDTPELIDLRDQAYANERMGELLYTDANNSLQYTVALRAEEQSRTANQMAASAHRLNIMAAMFFPIATFSALFGVNLEHTLEKTAPPWPFLVLTLTGLLMGTSLVAFMLKPSKDSV